MSKFLTGKNYGSIPHLLGSKLGQHDKFITQGQNDIATKKARDWKDTIWVTEKIDGSNVGVVKQKDEVYAVTRSGYLCSESKFKTHHNFLNGFFHLFKNDLRQILNNGERMAFEFVDTKNPCSIEYEFNKVYLLDYFDLNNKRRPFLDLIWLSGLLNIDIPRIIHAGQPIDVKRLIKQEYALHSLYTNEQAEGMVYRVERNGEFDFMAKWVRQDFIPGKLLKKD